MDCGYILYWVLFVCVLFGIVDIVMGMLFCNFCGPHCCCTAFCLAALFSLSSLVRLFLPCCGFSVFLGNGRMVSNFLLSKMEEWFSNMFSSSLSYLASGQWLIMVLSLQRSVFVLVDDTFFPAAIVVKLLLKLWCFHLSLAASQQGGIKCGNRGTGSLDSEGSHR